MKKVATLVVCLGMILMVGCGSSSDTAELEARVDELLARTVVLESRLAVLDETIQPGLITLQNYKTGQVLRLSPTEIIQTSVEYDGNGYPKELDPTGGFTLGTGSSGDGYLYLGRKGSDDYLSITAGWLTLRNSDGKRAVNIMAVDGGKVSIYKGNGKHYWSKSAPIE